MGEMINNAEIYSLAYQIMEETQQVGTAIQPVPVHFPQTITERLKISASIPSNFKTSMYQEF
jgi:ketopantoate reductase